MRAYWLPKSSSAESEWEDGFAFDESRYLAAVSDGASSAAHASTWARHLASGFVENPFPPASASEFASWLSGLQRAWSPPTPETNNWWGDVVTKQDSWATVAVLSANANEGRWQVNLGSIGDTCWFHIRSGVLLSVFPPLGSDDFDSHPELVGTSEESMERSAAAYCAEAFDGASGDVVVGATDALAEWALRTEANSSGVWSALERIGMTGLARLTCDERAAGRMVDDDVTLLRCRLGDPS